MAEDQTRSREEADADEEGQAQNESAGGIPGTLAQELKQAVREAAGEVLGPAARQATSSAAKYAVSKGPELVSKNVMPAVTKAGGPGGLAQQAISKGGEALSEAGGVGGVAGKLVSKVTGGGGGGDASGWGRNRRMPVQQWVYISVPVRHAYNGWTEYKQWPRYMHRANQVDPQFDDQSVRLRVTEKMWGFTRPFTAEVISQRPDEHIKWESREGTKHTGVLNFHELGPRLTLIELSLDHSPSGMVEKLARGARFVKRAIRADFHRFQAWIEMKSDEELDELEGWRGTIEDGQVVKSHEDAVGEERRPEEGEEEEPAGEYDGEPEGEAEEEYEEEEEPEAAGEEEPEEAPARRQPRRRRRPAAEEEEEPEAAGEEEPEEAPARQPRRRRRPAAEEEEEPQAAETRGPRRRRPARQQSGR